MADITQSLFGITPESLIAQREQQAMARGVDLAQLDPFQRAFAQTYAGASGLGREISGLLGAEDPELAKATAFQSILKQADTTTPEGLASLAKTLSSQGFAPQALQVMDQARQARQQAAQVQKAELTLQQEESLRKELANLGTEATEADILKVVTKYGPADKIMAALQTAQSKREALASQEQRAVADRESRERVSQEANATRAMIAQMQNATTQMLGMITAGMKRDQLDEKALAADQAKLGAIASFDTAITTLNSLDTHPGKKSALGLTGPVQALIPKTDAYGFAANLETFKAQTFVPMVAALKGMGALSDAEGKKLTDAVGALDIKMKESEFNSQLSKIKQDLAVSMARAKATVKNKALIEPFMELKNTAIPSTAGAEGAAAQGGWSIKVKQ